MASFAHLFYWPCSKTLSHLHTGCIGKGIIFFPGLMMLSHLMFLVFDEDIHFSEIHSSRLLAISNEQTVKI